MGYKQKTPTGYLHVGRRYVSLSFLLTLSLGFLALLALYTAAVHPTVMQKWLELRETPVFRLDSPYLADYVGNARLVLGDGGLLYEGAVENAAANGEGRLYENGVLVYEGKFSENMYQGWGRRYNPDGSLMYEGGFEANMFAGQGTMHIERSGIKYTYTGSFHEGEQSGFGRLYRDGTLIYEGYFEDGLYHGEGAEYATDFTYIGGFTAGAYSGAGKLYGKDGALLYDGVFLLGRYDGSGKLYRDGVLLYEGEFSDGKYNGTGTEYDTATGFPVFSGKYAFGVRMKAGTAYDESGLPIVDIDAPTPKPEPLSLLGESYSDVVSVFTQSGAALKEQAVDSRTLFIVDMEAGVIYCFAVSDDGTPDRLSQIYYYGLLSAEGIVVGSDISDAAWTATGGADMNSPEMLVLGYSNALWSRDISASKTKGSIFAGSVYTITAFYLPSELPELPVEEPADVTPSGRILFLRIEAT